MSLPEIRPELIERNNAPDDLKTKEMFSEMFLSQPVLKNLVSTVVNSDKFSREQKDFYCKGVLQTWYLMNQECMIREIE